VAARTRYARNGKVSIAYQVTGEGAIDLVMVPGYISHLDLDWAEPLQTHFLHRLGSFCRLIRFDKRGTGLSDPVPEVSTLEERMEDVHAVMDAAGSERAALFGVSQGGSMAALFAATYPERTAALIVYGSFIAGSTISDAVWNRILEAIDNHWGEGANLELFAPSVAHEEIRRTFIGTYERASASPGMARALVEADRRTDVAPVLPTIGVPTLILHRRGDFIPIEGARQMARLIPAAKLVELEGRDHVTFLGDGDAIVDEIEAFLTGARRAREPERALATVLFTDIVASTEHAAKLGDARWRELLSRHNEIVRSQVGRFGGRTVDSAGDGFLTAFDGPARAIRCACAIREQVHELGIDVRAGIHTGECELMGDHIAGIAVHIGARVAAIARAGEVVVSSTVVDLVVGSGIRFTERGTERLKGVPGDWRLYSVADGSPPTRRTQPIEESRAVPRRDRVAVTVARHAPWLSRSLARALLPSTRGRR
jgi:class 3 adenylate cyclase